MRARWLIVGGIFVGALVWLWRSTQVAPAPAQPSAEPQPEQAPQSHRTATIAPKPHVVIPAKQSTFDATAQHSADPCSALVDAETPPGFESITAAGITVAWDPPESTSLGPFDQQFRPIALAYATAGVLEEAALLTGTERRQQLTVIVDATTDDFRLRTKTPAWVGGLYDGGAVHIPAYLRSDLGVVMATLRHEVMHAQIHAGIGCVPFWFNEGVANYFAGIAPVREWLAMMRGDQFDLARVRDPAILDVRADDASRMYAVAEAMVLYVVHHAGEQGLREAARIAQTSKTPLDLWEQVPHADYRTVVDSLAQKVFGMPTGGELDAILKGQLCCKNTRVPAELSCHAMTIADAARRELCRRY